MDKIDALLFDLDGTLLDFDIGAYNTCILGVAETIASRHGIDPARLQQEHLRLSVTRWTEVADGIFRGGTMDGMEILLDIWREALHNLGSDDEEAARAGHDAYWQARHNIFRLYDETLEVLDSLRGRLPIALVTNGPEFMQQDKLLISNLTDYFDAVITSGALGVGKPDPRIFQLALDRVGADASRAWHIGDNLKADIGGARGSGIHAVWINRNAAILREDDPRPDAEITNLRELLPLLGV